LRKALTEHVQLAKKTGRFRRHAKDGFIEANDLVKQYVREGSTFDYAERVLRSAGFALEPRRSPDTPTIFVGSEYECDVNGWLGGHHGGRWEGGAQCIVALRPAQPYDYGVVDRVLTDCSFSLLFSNLKR
jgi:hypothetical protein